MSKGDVELSKKRGYVAFFLLGVGTWCGPLEGHNIFSYYQQINLRNAQSTTNPKETNILILYNIIKEDGRH